ncbi:hypothetical protein CAPI_04215 [Corynebacterium capitovis DSM 44611]|uniref:hypothetical protein n=1 Tax=Corynebacterium capitovis TaxID=131081 RepID=UPI0003726A2F|nr:hypothetical protein [Corynebacterium capitovis]WKD57401.1 hypothetical protein CAPI_04215 [Corynebacterium capitovis DSM 44611]
MRKRTRSGAAAGLLAASLLAGSIVGVVWGFSRPAYVGVVVGDGVEVDQIATPDSAEFASLGWFVILTAVLGAAVAALAYARAHRGPAMLGWVMVTSLGGAFATYTFGEGVAHLASADPSAFSEGARLSVVPALYPGTGWLAAPCLAALTYWLLSVVGELDTASAKN